MNALRMNRVAGFSALALTVILAAHTFAAPSEVLRSRDQTAATSSIVQSAPVTSYTEGASGPGQFMVNCGPGQQAMVRQVVLNGRLVTQVDCVQTAAPVILDRYGAGEDARVVPISTYRSRSSARRVQEQIVYREAPPRRARTWKKSAVMIGGSSATGAGVGALIGGKNGALAGAAIGGGVSAIYEATKHR